MMALWILTALAAVTSVLFTIEAVRRARIGTQQTYYRITSRDDQ